MVRPRSLPPKHLLWLKVVEQGDIGRGLNCKWGFCRLLPSRPKCIPAFSVSEDLANAEPRLRAVLKARDIGAKLYFPRSSSSSSFSSYCVFSQVHSSVPPELHSQNWLKSFSTLSECLCIW